MVVNLQCRAGGVMDEVSQRPSTSDTAAMKREPGVVKLLANALT